MTDDEPYKPERRFEAFLGVGLWVISIAVVLCVVALVVVLLR